VVRELPGTGFRDRAAVAQQIALSLAGQGRYADAVPFAREAVDELRRGGVTDHPLADRGVAVLALAAGDRDAYRRYLAGLASRLGPTPHPAEVAVVARAAAVAPNLAPPGFWEDAARRFAADPRPVRGALARGKAAVELRAGRPTAALGLLIRPFGRLDPADRYVVALAAAEAGDLPTARRYAAEADKLLVGLVPSREGPRSFDFHELIAVEEVRALRRLVEDRLGDASTK
jgi:hypothetical protein